MHYVGNCSVKNDKNTYFMSFCTSHKQNKNCKIYFYYVLLD
jgi:hypothetical protein